VNVRCRFCTHDLDRVVLDLGTSPLSNALVDPARAGEDERFPLRAFACARCWLVQVPDVQPRERIFADYPYFSSMSSTWVAHNERFAEEITHRLALRSGALVVELASNDGCLLTAFARRGVGVLGIEPAENVAAVARAAGIPTISKFFGRAVALELASSGRSADLLVANNVLAHVPDLDDFVGGIAALLAPAGVASLEFPHLLRTIERGEIDTFYHEHFSYLSLVTARRIFAAHGLVVTDALELPTHGGSLRLEVRHRGAAQPGAAVERIAREELSAGLETPEGYAALQPAAERVKRDLGAFLTFAASEGKQVAGYGAPAKATTLLNWCGVTRALLPYTVDRSPHKQGRAIPGVRVPIFAPERIFATKPDYVLILPWNIADEVRGQMAGISQWGGRFVLPIPEVAVA
jgi:SAM-dependent methyltransferase